MRNLGTFALLCLIICQGAAADPDRSFGEHGSFNVNGFVSDTDETPSDCLMVEEFEGPGSTTLLIARYVDEPSLIVVAVENYNWTIKPKETIENLRYEMVTGEYSRTGFGMESGIYHGILAKFPYSDFMSLFAKSTYLHIYRSETVVDRLEFKNTSDARVAFERCWSWLKIADAEARRLRHKFDNIPKDPFAPKD